MKRSSIHSLRATLLLGTLAATGWTAAGCVGQADDDGAGAPAARAKSPAAPANPGSPAPGGESATPGVTPPAAGAPTPVGTGSTPPAATPTAPLAFQPLPPAAYGAKVKDLLTGLGLKDEERKLLVGAGDATKTQAVLKTLIDSWMALPEFRGKMFEFFKNAFQQTQLDRSDLEEQLRISDIPGPEQTKMLRAVEDSFALTVLDLVANNRPFTEALTTNRFMMNVPMMVALSYMDAAPKNDLNAAVPAGYWIVNKYGAKTFKMQLTTNTDLATGIAASIPIEQTVDPASPNFLRFVFRQPDPAKYKPCVDPTVTMGANAMGQIFRALYGGRQGCQGAQNEPSLFTDADWNTYRMVSVRPPKAGEDRTLFWELPKMRGNMSELVLATPRVGFMTSIAFFANWPTNPSNQYRVTLNQALIVALGKSFDDRGTSVQLAETSVDQAHIQAGSVCFACHQTLDPMRDFYKQSYSMTFSQQLDLANPKNPMPETAVFAVDGAPAVKGKGIEILAQAMATHPRFPVAWAQKLCTLANSEECAEDDTELKRVADMFKKNNFNFKVLVREIFSSPIVTFAAKTKTSETYGVVMSIARRETFCARVSNRLGVKDICNTGAESALPRIANQARNLSLGIPGSAYSRADEKPMMPHDPNLFFVDGTEKMCWAIAGQLIDGGPTSKWLSKTQKDQAIIEWTENLMGVPPSDPKHDPIIGILQKHYAAAVVAKEIPADALRSTFVAACASPLGVATGL